ncbi:MAG: hypothetical protein AAFX50_04680, partial [Acidobacteriota bacterium]
EGGEAPEPSAPLRFALWQERPAQPVFHLAFLVDRPDVDLEELEARFVLEVVDYLTDEDGFTLDLSSDGTRVVRGTLDFAADEEAIHLTTLMALWFFGILIII